MKQMSRLML